MKELRSRAGDDASERPCQLAALSGRRAAQGGPRRRPGGPERAGLKRSGEAPSAGRAAAPSQVPGAVLGRGRSAARVTGASAQRAKPAELVGQSKARPCERAGLGRFQARARAVVAILSLLVGPADAADNFVKPGDTGSINWEFRNDAQSGGPMTGVILSVTAPAQFVKQGTSQLGPVDIPAGQSYTFRVDYSIAADALDGSFQVGLHLAQTTKYATNKTQDTSVIFAGLSLPFLLDRLS